MGTEAPQAKTMDDFPKAALKHLEDAWVLRDEQRFDGAAYLAGYVVECTLKTVIEAENPPVPRSHDLSNLQQTGQQLALRAGPRTGTLYIAATQTLVPDSRVAAGDALSQPPRHGERGRNVDARSGIDLSPAHRQPHPRRNDLTQHLDDAHERAERFLSDWIEKKPGSWRVLVVKDVLAKIRVVLWCPEKAWESGSDEIDRKLQDTCGDYWARSVLQGHNEKHPDGAWQDEAWQQATRRESTKKLRILERHLTKSGWFDAPPEPPDTLGGFDWSLMARMVRGLMAFWSDYSRRWKRIRAKIFLRSDLFRRHAGMGTADFAKLAANRADLTWSDGALLGMLAKRIANTSDGLAAYCRGARLKLEHHDALGLIPIVRDPRDAFPLLERLAGEFMGAERKKGFVRNWILAHLRDGNGLVSPRSLGRLFEQAAGKDAANQSVSPPRLIHPTALRQALDDVSDSHVTQGTSSEWPWLDGVRTRLQNDRLVPWEQRKITSLLAADWDGRWAPEAQSDVRPPEDRPADFVDYLTELGIFRQRSDNRVDVPDLYLSGLNLRRKGGVRRRDR